MTLVIAINGDLIQFTAAFKTPCQIVKLLIKTTFVVC